MREAFLLDPDIVFLNHGSFGACPREVLADYQRWQRELERNPVEFLGRRSAALLDGARSTLAAHVGARSDDLVFVTNATTGVNAVARSLGLGAGDEILATDHEYGACDATWQQVCTQVGAHYRRVPIPLPFDPGTWADRLLAAATARTRMVFASHITSATALVFPVEALCAAARQRGIATFIDGAHAPGQIALDLQALGADYYTGNCHKWLCAPKGSAFLHVAPPGQAAIEAPVVSWGYIAPEGDAVFDAYTGRGPLQRRLQWLGTRDIAAFLAVPAAIDFQRRHDWPARQARCRDLAWDTQQRVLQNNGLSPIAPRQALGQMVPIPVRRGDAQVLQQALFQRHRIEVPVTRHGPHTLVRVSVQAYNTPADLDRLVAALATEGA